MRTSWRNKLLVGALLCAAGAARASGPITTISISRNVGSTGNFAVGVDTNSSSSLGNIYVTVTAAGTPPTSGQTVSVELLNGSNVLSGGLSPALITTDGINTIYGGSSFGAFPLKFFRAGTGLTIRVTVTANGTLTVTSAALNVNAGTAAKILLLAPGMALAPGQDPNVATGVSGRADTQQPGQTFALTAVQTDTWFNQVAGASPSITLTSTDLASFSPTTQALIGGQAVYSVTIGDSQKTVTITSTGGPASGSVDIPMGGPEKEQVFPYPSPFNPHAGGAMHFKFQLNDNVQVSLVIKDRFGQNVWHGDISGAKGPNDATWDGRNENGNVVAAGTYYVLLKVGGEVKSKKPFGVVK